MTIAGPTILVTGSSRGIGLALVECYASRDWSVIATCRDPDGAGELRALSEKYANVFVETLDVADPGAIHDIAERYADTAIDVLMNNAGFLGRPDAQCLNDVDLETFDRVMHINTYAPLLLATQFLEHVARSEQKKIVTLTSGLSSIAFTEQFGGFYFYRASKAAINIAMRALQADVRDRDITASVVAPGLVNTELLTESGYQGESIEPNEAAEELFKYIERLQPNTAQGFVVPPEKILPW